MKQLACLRARETFGADRSSPYLLGCGYARSWRMHPQQCDGGNARTG
jgi:hypothetical protein